MNLYIFCMILNFLTIRNRAIFASIILNEKDFNPEGKIKRYGDNVNMNSDLIIHNNNFRTFQTDDTQPTFLPEFSDETNASEDIESHGISSLKQDVFKRNDPNNGQKLRKKMAEYQKRRNNKMGQSNNKRQLSINLNRSNNDPFQNVITHQSVKTPQMTPYLAEMKNKHTLSDYEGTGSAQGRISANNEDLSNNTVSSEEWTQANRIRKAEEKVSGTNEPLEEVKPDNKLIDTIKLIEVEDTFKDYEAKKASRSEKTLIQELNKLGYSTKSSVDTHSILIRNLRTNEYRSRLPVEYVVENKYPVSSNNVTNDNSKNIPKRIVEILRESSEPYAVDTRRSIQKNSRSKLATKDSDLKHFLRILTDSIGIKNGNSKPSIEETEISLIVKKIIWQKSDETTEEPSIYYGTDRQEKKHSYGEDLIEPTTMQTPISIQSHSDTTKSERPTVKESEKPPNRLDVRIYSSFPFLVNRKNISQMTIKKRNLNDYHSQASSIDDHHHGRKHKHSAKGKVRKKESLIPLAINRLRTKTENNVAFEADVYAGILGNSKSTQKADEFVISSTTFDADGIDSFSEELAGSTNISPTEKHNESETNLGGDISDVIKKILLGTGIASENKTDSLGLKLHHSAPDISTPSIASLKNITAHELATETLSAIFYHLANTNKVSDKKSKQKNTILLAKLIEAFKKNVDAMKHENHKISEANSATEDPTKYSEHPYLTGFIFGISITVLILLFIIICWLGYLKRKPWIKTVADKKSSSMMERLLGKGHEKGSGEGSPQEMKDLERLVTAASDKMKDVVWKENTKRLKSRIVGEEIGKIDEVFRSLPCKTLDRKLISFSRDSKENDELSSDEFSSSESQELAKFVNKSTNLPSNTASESMPEDLNMIKQVRGRSMLRQSNFFK